MDARVFFFVERACRGDANAFTSGRQRKGNSPPTYGIHSSRMLRTMKKP